MKRKIVATIIISVVTIAVGIGSVIAYNAITTNRTGLTFSMNMGNNDGTSVVYSTDLSRANAATANGPTLTNEYVDLDGNNEAVTTTATGVYNTANTCIAVKFNPDTAVADNTADYFYDSENGKRYYSVKNGNAQDNSFQIGMNNTVIAQISTSTYAPYWNVGEENIYIICGTTGDTSAWLNGNQILTNDASAWTPADPSYINIGASLSLGNGFNGKIYYMKVWDRILTSAERDIINADRTNNVQSAPRNGLVGHWNMDSSDVNGTTIYDKSGEGNDGISTNTPSIVNGIKKEAMSFNGISDFVEISRVSDFTWGTTQDFSIVTWFFSSTTSHTAYASMVDAANGVPRWEMGITSSNNLYVQAHDGSNDATPQIANPADGQWHQLVGVFDRDGDATLYLDVDTTDSEAMSSVGNITVATSLFIGKNNNNNYYFSDKLDDIRIYSRALSVGDIRNLYNATKINYVQSAPRNGLIGYWNMDSNDINGTTVYDKSGQGNNGTITDATSAEGVLRESLNFDADNDTVVIPQTDATSIRTFSLWVKTTNIKGWGAVFGQGVVGDGFSLGCNNETADCYLRIDTSADSNQAIGGATTFDGLRDGEWHNVIFSINSSTAKVSGWMDGVIKINDLDFLVGDGIDYTQDIIVLDAVVGAKDNQYGYIDDLRVYNRALSTTEVTQLFNSAKINYIK